MLCGTRQRAEPALQSVLAGVSEATEEEQLLEQIFDRVLGDRQQLPLDAVPATGMPPWVEQRLSPVHLRPFAFDSRCYGTRSQTVALVWRSGRAVACERSIDADGQVMHTAKEEFQIRL